MAGHSDALRPAPPSPPVWLQIHETRYLLGPAIPGASKGWALINQASQSLLHVLRPGPPEEALLARAIRLSPATMALEPFASWRQREGVTQKEWWMLPYDGGGSASRQACEQLVGRGREALHAGLLPLAISCGRQALSLAHDFVPALHLLGLALLQSGQPAEAMQCLEQALALEPHLPALYEALLKVAHEQGAHAVFVRALERRRRVYSHAVAADVRAVHAYLAMGQPAAAKAELERSPSTSEAGASKDGGSSPALWDQVEEALEASEEAEALFAQAQGLRLEHNQVQAAAELLYQAHEVYPLHALVKLNLGLALVGAGAFSEGIVLLEQADGVVQGAVETKIAANIGFACIRQGRLPEALTWLERTWTRLRVHAGGERPEASPETAPCIASWIDRAQCIESSPLETAAVVEKLVGVCKELGLEVPRAVMQLTEFYHRAHALAHTRTSEASAPEVPGRLPSPGGSRPERPAVESSPPGPGQAEVSTSAAEAGEGETPTESARSWELRVLGSLGDGTLGPRYRVVAPEGDTIWHAERVNAQTSDERRRLWSALRVWFNLPAHDHLAECVGFRWLPDGVYVLFEPLEGESLDAWLSGLRQAALPQPRLVRSLMGVAIHTAWALEVAHKYGVTHGPLRPSQVRVVEGRPLRIDDFWRGRCLGEEQAVDEHVAWALESGEQGVGRDDAAGRLLREVYETSLRSQLPVAGVSSGGALDELPPEMTVGAGQSVASDAWYWASFVVTCLVRACALSPGQPLGVASLLDEVVRSTFVGTASWQLPSELINILRRCLNDNPGGRPRSMGEVAEGLRTIFSHQYQQTFDALPPAESGNRAAELLGPPIPTPRRGSRKAKDASRQRPESPSNPEGRSKEGGGGTGTRGLDGRPTYPKVQTTEESFADLPWRDPRYALSLAYHAAGITPLVTMPFVPEGDTSPRSRALAHLSALELSSSLLARAVEERQEPRLTAEWARQHFDMATILSTLGDVRGASLLGQRAVELLGSVADREKSAAYRYLLTSLTLEQGALYAAAEEPERATSCLEAAEKLFADTQPEANNLQEEEAQAHASLKLALTQMVWPERETQALDHFKQAIDIWTRHEKPDDAGFAWAALGTFLLRQGQAEEALRALEKAEAQVSYGALQERQTNAMRTLGRVWLAQFELYLKARDFEQARRVSQAANEMYTQLVEKQGHHDLSGFLAQSCHNQAQLLLRDGDTTTALDMLRQGRTALERRALQEPDGEVLPHLIYALHMEAELGHATGFKDAALQLTERSIWWAEQAASHPETARVVLLAESLRRHGCMLVSEGSPELAPQAERELLKAEVLYQLFAQEFRLPPLVASDLALHRSIALQRAGKHAHALVCVQQALLALEKPEDVGEDDGDDEGKAPPNPFPLDQASSDHAPVDPSPVDQASSQEQERAYLRIRSHELAASLLCTQGDFPLATEHARKGLEAVAQAQGQDFGSAPLGRSASAPLGRSPSSPPRRSASAPLGDNPSSPAIGDILLTRSLLWLHLQWALRAQGKSQEALEVTLDCLDRLRSAIARSAVQGASPNPELHTALRQRLVLMLVKAAMLSVDLDDLAQATRFLHEAENSADLPEGSREIAPLLVRWFRTVADGIAAPQLGQEALEAASRLAQRASTSLQGEGSLKPGLETRLRDLRLALDESMLAYMLAERSATPTRSWWPGSRRPGPGAALAARCASAHVQAALHLGASGYAQRILPKLLDRTRELFKVQPKEILEPWLDLLLCDASLATDPAAARRRASQEAPPVRAALARLSDSEERSRLHNKLLAWEQACTSPSRQP